MKNVRLLPVLFICMIGFFAEAGAQYDNISIELSLGSAHVYMKDLKYGQGSFNITEYSHVMFGHQSFNHSPFFAIGGSVGYTLCKSITFLLSAEYCTIFNSVSDITLWKDDLHISEWEHSTIPVSASLEYRFCPQKVFSPFIGYGLTCFHYTLRNCETMIAYNEDTYESLIYHPDGSEKKDNENQR